MVPTRDEIEQFNEALKQVVDAKEHALIFKDVAEQLIKSCFEFPPIFPTIGSSWNKQDITLTWNRAEVYESFTYFKKSATSHFYIGNPIRITSDFIKKPEPVLVTGYHFLNVHDELIAVETAIQTFEREQREEAIREGNKEQKSKAWSAEVRKKVKALRPPGPQVYCQTDDDD